MEVISKNRKASFDYELLTFYTAGLEITGSEIKSIRNKDVNIKEAFIKIDSNLEIFIYNFHISKYKQSTNFQVEPNRPKKLLLNKKEIIEIYNQVKQQGLTVIPTQVIISDNNFAKVIIAVAKGKKNYDKRESIKKRDLERDSAAYFKKYK